MNLASIYRGPSAIDAPRMSLITDATFEPLTLTEAKTWLRVDTSADDALIMSLVSAARRHFESVTGVCIASQQWLVSFSQTPARYGAYGMEYGLAPAMSGYVGSPNGREFIFPRAPLITVDSFKYLDFAGALQTFDPLSYSVGSVGARNSFGRLWLNDGYDWPSIGAFPNAIQITFTAGLATTQANVKEDVKQAIRWLLSTYYEHRLPHDTTTLADVPHTLQSYIESFRVSFIA